MRFAPFALAATLLVVGCGDGEEDEINNTNPTTGTWFFVEGEIFDDSCDTDYTDPSGDFTVTSTGEGTFTIHDGRNLFDCTVSGSTFTCPSRHTGTVWGVVNINISLAGTFSSATEASGHQTADLTCEGAHCVSGIPCAVSQHFTASHTGG